MDNTITKVCQMCGKEFIASTKNQTKFCSRSCASRYVNSLRGFPFPSIIKICQRCGKEFIGKPPTIVNRKYCSRSCANKSKSKDTYNKIHLSNIGRKHSLETRLKISQTHTGIGHTEETKQKLSKIVFGYFRKHKPHGPFMFTDSFGNKLRTRGELKVSEYLKLICFDGVYYKYEEPVFLQSHTRFPDFTVYMLDDVLCRVEHSERLDLLKKKVETSKEIVAQTFRPYFLVIPKSNIIALGDKIQGEFVVYDDTDAGLTQLIDDIEEMIYANNIIQLAHESVRNSNLTEQELIEEYHLVFGEDDKLEF